MHREFALPATVPRQLLDALEDVAEAAQTLHDDTDAPLDILWEALARLAAAREQTKGTG